MVVNAGQLLLALIALATVVAVVLVLQRTTFGRAYRACADDWEAAALMGVDVARTVRTTCMLGGLLAGVAGFVIAAFAIHEGREAWAGELVEDDDDD